METWRIVEKRTDVQVVAGRVTKAEVAEALGVPRRTINRYLARFGAEEPAGLRDRRHSNYRKAEAAMETVVVQAKKDGLHRGARFLRDYLEFVVSPETVRYILVKPHLERTSLPPIKPIGRFEAAEPNALWQDDIQGKVRFPLLGGQFLVLVKDDHSRLLLAGPLGDAVGARLQGLECQQRALEAGRADLDADQVQQVVRGHLLDFLDRLALDLVGQQRCAGLADGATPAGEGDLAHNPV